MDENGFDRQEEGRSLEQIEERVMRRPARFWDSWPWRRWLAGLAATTTVASVAGSFLLPTHTQIAITQFMIPPYSYVCLGLAVIALTELRESLGRRILIAILLLAMTVLSVFSYAAGGVAPLAILGTHLGCLIGWIAWPRRTGWTLLWLGETLAWIGLAIAQGRLP